MSFPPAASGIVVDASSRLSGDFLRAQTTGPYYESVASEPVVTNLVYVLRETRSSFFLFYYFLKNFKLAFNIIITHHCQIIILGKRKACTR